MTVAIEDLAGALVAWLGERFGADDVTVSGFARPAAGQSSDNVLFDASANGNVEHLVLRRQTEGTTIFRSPDVCREAQVLRGLATAGLRVPKVRWIEPNSAVLGAPFFVMDRVQGRVPLGKPSIHTTGWLPTLTPAERERLWLSALDFLVSLHAIPWPSTHGFLLDSDPNAATLGAHVTALGDWYRWSTAERVYPITDAALEFLEEHVTEVDAGQPVLLWGDPRVGNILFADDNTVAAAVDWETAGIGPAGRDVAHWLFFDEFQTEAVGIERLPGWPDRDSTVACYEASSGRRLGDLLYFDVMESLFMATTLIRQADRREAMGVAPPGNRMGHDNTVTQMLARKLGLAVPPLSPDYIAHRGGPPKRERK
ncbi:MAG TPA: phosphotransferase family protein [Acidimicrobiales bacterium]|jgi:aminoglycoside phosphotransferase (APT) family kinase protein